MRTFSELLADLKAVGTVAVLLVFLRLFRQDIQALFRTLFGH